MAKHVLQVADYAQTQIVEHLFKIHLYMEPICVCVHRRLSKLHPLHQLLKHHCRGLLGTNALGHPFLMAPGNGSIDKLMVIGRQGAMTMMRRAYNDLSWEKTDFLVNIKVGAANSNQETKSVVVDNYRKCKKHLRQKKKTKEKKRELKYSERRETFSNKGN